MEKIGEKELYISNIQRMSTEDGPGIRTTIFLKGCRMRCAWCHNPESLSLKPELGILTEKCQGCGACISACTPGALSLHEEHIKVDDRICTRCFRCVSECYNHVLVPVGSTWKLEKLVDTVLEDRTYFDVSGGGVTFSGGEPLLQENVADAIRLFRAEGVDVMVETALQADITDDMTGALKECSLLYADLKLWDEEKHRKWTGTGNRRIIENIRNLDEKGVKMLIRTPVIKGVNDEEEELMSISSFVKTLRNAAGYKLIPYHPFGLAKYKEFRIAAAYRDEEEYDEERFRALEEAVRNA